MTSPVLIFNRPDYLKGRRGYWNGWFYLEFYCLPVKLVYLRVLPLVGFSKTSYFRRTPNSNKCLYSKRKRNK